MRQLTDFVDELQDDRHSLVLFVDAYDVLHAATPTALLRRMVSSGARVLFSAEKGCCGSRDATARLDSSCDPAWPSPTSPTATPFLNSGAIAAFVPELRALLAAAAAEHADARVSSRSSDGRDAYTLGTDQLLMCHLFAHASDQRGTLRKTLGMAVDYNSRLFLSMYQVRLGDSLSFSGSGRPVHRNSAVDCTHFAPEQKSLRDWCERAIRGEVDRYSYPVVLHFNGADEDKRKMNAAAARMNWPNSTAQAFARPRCLHGNHKL